MSRNIDQLPVTTAPEDNDKVYLGRSPYGVTDDFAILWQDLKSDSIHIDANNNMYAGKLIPGTVTGSENHVYGIGTAGGALTTGSQNVFLGFNTANSVTTGGSNVVIGRAANLGAGNQQTVVIGRNATSSGDFSVSIGENANATGAQAVGVGHNASAAADSVAIGNNGQAGQTSIGIGVNVDASQTNCMVIGPNANATGTQAIVVGQAATAAANGLAFGFGADSAQNAVTIGNAAITTGNDSVAIGLNTQAALNGITIGQTAAPVVSGAGNLVIGSAAASTLTTGTNNVILGINAAVSSVATSSAVALGPNTTVESGGVAIGSGTTASNTNTTAVGTASTATAVEASAFGNGADATGTAATAIGFGPTAAGPSSTVIGNGAVSTAPAISAIAIGSSASVTGSGAIAMGSLASGDAQNAIVIGGSADANGGLRAIAIGNASNSGQDGIAIGTASNATTSTIAIGDSAAANTSNSIAMGTNAVANLATDCMSIGATSQVTATRGMAFGILTEAGNLSMAIGYSAKAPNLATTSVGYLAGLQQTTGDQNTFIGHQAGQTTTTGDQIVCVGLNAVGAAAGDGEFVAVGASAEAGDQGVAVGQAAIAHDNAIAIGNNTNTVAARDCYLGDTSNLGDLVFNGRPINRATMVNTNDGIIVANGVGWFDKLDAGTDGYVLSADSGEPSGFKWIPDSTGADTNIYNTSDTVPAATARVVTIPADSSVKFDNAGGPEYLINNVKHTLTGDVDVTGVLKTDTLDSTSAGDITLNQQFALADGTTRVEYGQGATAGATLRSIVIGPSATATANDCILIGSGTTNDSTNAIAIGTNAKGVAQGVAIGTSANTGFANCIAIGYQAGLANVAGSGNVYIGNQAGLTATTSSNVLIGNGVDVDAAADTRAIGIGSNVSVATDAVGIGDSVQANGNNTVAIGSFARANGDNNTSVGTLALSAATGTGNTAFGKSAAALLTTGTNGAYFGFGATSNLNNDVEVTSLGYSATAGNRSVAVGAGAIAVPNDSIAIGRNATAVGANDCYIGAASAAGDLAFNGRAVMLASFANTNKGLLTNNGVGWNGKLDVGADGFVLVADSLEVSGMKWQAPGAGDGNIYDNDGSIPASTTRTATVPGSSTLSFTGGGAANQVRVTNTDLLIATSNDKLNIQGALDVLSIGHDGTAGTFVIQRSIAGTQQIKLLPTATGNARLEMGGAASTGVVIDALNKAFTLDAGTAGMTLSAAGGAVVDSGDLTVNNTHKLRVQTLNKTLEISRNTDDVVNIGYDNAGTTDSIYGLGLNAGAGRLTRLLVGSVAGAKGELDFFSSSGGVIQTSNQLDLSVAGASGSIDIQTQTGWTFNGGAVKASIIAGSGTGYIPMGTAAADQLLVGNPAALTGLEFRDSNTVPFEMQNMTTATRTGLSANPGRVV
jgi:hypothetical protein